MNIFVLNEDPKIAAQMHLDKHVVKMIIEYAQLLSTAHRIRDGRQVVEILPSGKKQKIQLLGKEVTIFESRLNPFTGTTVEKHYIVDPICYNLSHQNHPCAIWCRESDSNYLWLFKLLQETAAEFTHRYGKIHKTWTDTKDFLSSPPKNIPAGDLTPWPQAMGDEFKVQDDPVLAYQNYYIGAKAPFARWTNRTTPSWFKAGTKDFHVSNFERTTELA